MRKIRGQAGEQAETGQHSHSSTTSRRFGPLTRCRRLTNEIDQIFFDGVKRVKVVHDKDVPVAGFGGDLLQLVEVHVGDADGEDAVAWQQKRLQPLSGVKRLRSGNVRYLLAAAWWRSSSPGPESVRR